MKKPFFEGIEPIRYEGPQSENPLAFRYYDKKKIVAGKTLEDHLRVAVCYWHTFAWPGHDIFGMGTFDRPWFKVADPVAAAELKLQTAFEFFEKLGVPFFTFHDRDMAPEGATLKESHANLDRMVEGAQKEMERTKVRLLWGTANLFSHPRYMGGAATNPDPEVFAYAAAQVRKILDITQRLNGENYVLWGGREGYETLLNTDMKREADQMARFLTLVAEHKQKIGFKGMLLLEPKPKEPTKHQYDFDTATVHAFLQRYGLENEYRVNIEANHAILSGHTFQHEVAVRHQQRHLRQHRHEPRRLAARLGHRSVPERPPGDRARLLHDPERRRLHERRHELRREAPPAEHRSRGSVPRAHRRHGHARARRAHRRDA